MILLDKQQFSISANPLGFYLILIGFLFDPIGTGSRDPVASSRFWWLNLPASDRYSFPGLTQTSLGKHELGPGGVLVVCRGGRSATDPGQGLHPNLTKHPICGPRARGEGKRKLSAQQLTHTDTRDPLRNAAPGSERSFPLIPYLHPSGPRVSRVSLSLWYHAWMCSSTSGAFQSLLAENEKFNASVCVLESEEDINTEKKRNKEFKMKFTNVFV